VTHGVSRRGILAASGLALGACSRAEEPYFGNTAPPKTQQLVFVFDSEPGTLDPALALNRLDTLMLSLFEGLTSAHPVDGSPMAALATHCDVTSDRLRHTFWLRGHRQPGGIRLPDASALPPEYSRRRTAAPESAVARWSDKVPITAHDFVFSWRRVVDPSTAAADAYRMFWIRNAEEIVAGKVPPDTLAVRAIDDFTVQVDLSEPAPFFRQLVSGLPFCPAPRHVIAREGVAWTDPGRIVTSGAFTLHERRTYDQITLRRNPAYYDAGNVALDSLVFLIVPDVSAFINLYKMGAAAVAQPWIPTIMPTLRRKRDFHSAPYYASEFWVLNTKVHPLDDVRVRYALNMATNKRSIADLVAAGSPPASGVVPPTRGYRPPDELLVDVDGVVYDVLAFNPEAARRLLASTAWRVPRRLEYLTPNQMDAKLWAQVLKEQWNTNIGVELSIRTEELSVWSQSVQNRTYRHVAFYGSSAAYVDPSWFLNVFTTRDACGTGWFDPQYGAMVSVARAAADDAVRMSKLAECEQYLLRAMPIVPLCHDVQPHLRKPYVKGLGTNLLDRYPTRYAWIDTNWRPS
jgi:oligopeptide transport system substrate-binding protein